MCESSFCQVVCVSPFTFLLLFCNEGDLHFFDSLGTRGSLVGFFSRCMCVFGYHVYMKQNFKIFNSVSVETETDLCAVSIPSP